MTPSQNRRLNATVTQAVGRVPGWDIAVEIGRLAEGQFADFLRGASLLEVKRDRLFATTQRLFVEFEGEHANGEWLPSGVAVTTADAWVFALSDDPIFLVVPTANLRAVARRCWLEGRRKVGGIEGSRSLGVLVSLADLLADLEGDA